MKGMLGFAVVLVFGLYCKADVSQATESYVPVSRNEVIKDTNPIYEPQAHGKHGHVQKIITMNKSNLLEYQIKAVGNDVVLMYDIDKCLYSSNSPFVEEEKKYIKDFYNSLAKGKDCPDFDTAYSEMGRGRQLDVFHKNLGLEREKFQEFCCAFKFDEFLEKDHELRAFLDGIPIRKWCFTNSPGPRAMMILEALGISECFEGVICLDEEDPNFILKPMSESYEFVTKLLSVNDPSKIHFFDDTLENVIAAIEFGWNAYAIDKNIIEVTENTIRSIYAKAYAER